MVRQTPFQIPTTTTWQIVLLLILLACLDGHGFYLPLIEEAPAGRTEPIVTVRPPAEPAPAKIEPIVNIATPAEPAVEPMPIVTIKPAPPATTAGPSGGKARMAKPWERLGNPAAAARDFYKYAPSLSNY